MATPTVPLEKFEQLLTYLDAVAIDRQEVLRAAGLRPDSLNPDVAGPSMPAVYYSRLYKHAVLAMQALDSHVPWAAGIGTDAFEMLCRAIVGSTSLGEALERAERFSAVTAAVSGHRVIVEREGDGVKLCFFWQARNVTTVFSPETWYRAQGTETVVLASGLLVWHGLISWLVGHALQLDEFAIAGNPISPSYTDSLGSAVSVRPLFDASRSYIRFPAVNLELPVVQTHASLQAFLDDTVLQLIHIEQRPATVSEAVKRLLGSDFSRGLPTFNQIADRLHTSESSLRRRLLEEQTSFQALKDELRCELAIRYLSEPEARLSDIAERLGFTEQSSFGRSFRQWTGLTPKAWREANVREYPSRSA